MRLLILGTSSHAGKTVFGAMTCRYLHRQGLDPVPFKAFNLSTVSYPLPDGTEIGIGQAFQAISCGLEPCIDMNPVLMKPSEMGLEYNICGIPVDHDSFRMRADEEIGNAFERLSSEHQTIVCEGSGSPAEINLMDDDLANVGLMRRTGIPSIIVGDIERGGVFAAIYGTWRLIPDDVRDQVKGFVINRFRGEPGILKGAIDRIEELTGMKCLGVIPYLPLRFPEEDSTSGERIDGLGERRVCDHLTDLDTLLDESVKSGFDFDGLVDIARL